MSEVWFDRRLGEVLIGEAAFAGRVEETMPGDIVPLQDLLLADIFPVERQEYPRIPSSEWDHDQIVSVGAATLRLLQEAGHSGTITKKIMLRLYFLGLGPQPQAFFGTGKTFDTMQDFRKEIGAEAGYSRGKFDAWTREDFVKHGKRVEALAGGKPSANDYERFSSEIQQRRLPILSRVGSWEALVSLTSTWAIPTSRAGPRMNI